MKMSCRRFTIICSLLCIFSRCVRRLVLLKSRVSKFTWLLLFDEFLLKNYGRKTRFTRANFLVKSQIKVSKSTWLLWFDVFSWSNYVQVILFEIDCAISYTNLHELFCQFISWSNWVNSGKFMADMKKVYGDLIIINLYNVEIKVHLVLVSVGLLSFFLGFKINLKTEHRYSKEINCLL